MPMGSTPALGITTRTAMDATSCTGPAPATRFMLDPGPRATRGAVLGCSYSWLGHDAACVGLADPVPQRSSPRPPAGVVLGSRTPAVGFRRLRSTRLTSAVKRGKLLTALERPISPPRGLLHPRREALWGAARSRPRSHRSVRSLSRPVVRSPELEDADSNSFGQNPTKAAR